MNSKQRRLFKRYIQKQKVRAIKEHQSGSRGCWIYRFCKGSPEFRIELLDNEIDLFALGEKIVLGSYRSHRSFRPRTSTSLVKRWTYSVKGPYEELKSIDVLKEIFEYELGYYPAFELSESNYICFIYDGEICWRRCSHDSRRYVAFELAAFEEIFENSPANIQEDLLYHLDLLNDKTRSSIW